MKVEQIFILVVKILLICAWTKHRESTKTSGIGCRYLKEKSSNLKPTLNCNGTIECETYANYDGLFENYQMFGIEAINSTGLKLRFKLYPKNLTDQVFADSRVSTANGSTTDFVLYHSDVMIEPGFMVSNLTCFNKLANLFDVADYQISVNKMVKSNFSELFILGFILTV